MFDGDPPIGPSDDYPPGPVGLDEELTVAALSLDYPALQVGMTGLLQARGWGDYLPLMHFHPDDNSAGILLKLDSRLDGIFADSSGIIKNFTGWYDLTAEAQEEDYDETAEEDERK